MGKEERRKRPTAAEIKEMEETIHRQSMELNAWREKYRALKERGLWARVFNK